MSLHQFLEHLLFHMGYEEGSSQRKRKLSVLLLLEWGSEGDLVQPKWASTSLRHQG